MFVLRREAALFVTERRVVLHDPSLDKIVQLSGQQLYMSKKERKQQHTPSKYLS